MRNPFLRYGHHLPYMRSRTHSVTCHPTQVNVPLSQP